jgi:hypothetical protein
MAQLTTHGSWKSIAALASLFALVGIVAFTVIAHTSLGIWPYVAAFALMVFGFWSKEDHLAVAGISGLALVLLLDIILRIGILAFNHCKGTFTVLGGC